MKRVLQIIFVTIMCFSLFSCFTVKAEEGMLNLENIKVGEKSKAVGVNKLKLVNSDVTNDMFFNKVGDYINYDVVIKNTSDNDFIIKEVNDDNNNQYIKYEYPNSSNKVVAAGSEAVINVKATYTKKSPNKVVSNSSVNFNVLYDSYSGNHNANTVDHIIIYLSIFILSVIGFILTFTYNKKQSKLFIMILLSIGVLLPFNARAESKVISFKLNNTVTENSVSFLKTGKDVNKMVFSDILDRDIKWVMEIGTGKYYLSNTSYEGDTITSYYEEFMWFYGVHTDDLCDAIVVATLEQYNAVKNTLTASNIISVDESSIPTYYWFNNRTLYIYTEADSILLNEDSSYLFSFFYDLSSIDLSKINTSNVKRMSGMFKGASQIDQFDLSNFDFSKVTHMDGFFEGCHSLTSFDFSNFDISNLSDVSSMFEDCFSLTSINFGNNDILNLTDMSSLFKECRELSNIYNFENVKTSKVKRMGSLFEECFSLTSLNLSSFDTSNVEEMYSMFNGCLRLTSLDVSHFNTSKVTDMSYMFSGCGSLTTLDVSSFDTGNVENMSYMFNLFGYDYLTDEDFYSPITSLDVSNFDTSKVTDMSGMFCDNRNLRSLDLSNFDTRNVRNMSNMFAGDINLVNLDISSFVTGDLFGIDGMFDRCEKLISLDLSGFNTSSVEDMSRVFYGCSSLTELNISSFNTSSVTNFMEMFADCSSLVSLDISNFSSESDPYFEGMFNNCEALETIYVNNNFKLTNYEDFSNSFHGCTSLVGGSGTIYEDDKVNGDYARIDGGPSAPGYFTLKV